MQIILCLLAITFSLQATTDSLMISGEPYEILSSRDRRLSGVLSKPVFSPFPSRLVSFERQDGSDHYLHIYDLGAEQLYEITMTESSEGENVSEANSNACYSGQIDWRPQLDKEGNQWFTFVSNADGDNRNIYVGSVGQNTYLQLSSAPGEHYSPRWSPDGKSIAYISSATGAGDIYLIENVAEAIEKRDLTKLRRKQLTANPFEELDIAWNPDPNARLLAYARLQQFPGREISTFQIHVLDLAKDEDNIYRVTDDPLADYTKPQWDPHKASRLLYIGQSVTGIGTANLYVTELAWGDGRKLRNKDLEGYKTEVFKNIELVGSRAVWLEGGRSILCQSSLESENDPLYAVNVDRWLNKEENAIVYMSDLQQRFPRVSEFDSRSRNLMVIAERGGYSRLYLAMLEGKDVETRKENFTLSSPSRISWGKYLLSAGLVTAAGATTWLLINRNSEDESPVPIGLPPNLPN